ATAIARHPGAPVFLLGHSMGGCLAVAYALRYQDRLNGLVLSAPVAALETASPAERVLGAILSAVAAAVGGLQIDPNLVSNEPERGRVVGDLAAWLDERVTAPVAG